VGDIHIGISGWRYAPWRGVFYPPEVAQRRELEFAAHTLPSIELNGSFYRLQRPEHYIRWHEQTPANFLFAVKGGRYITHMRRLRDIDRPLANFFASGVLALRAKMGPFLWQFPPSFRYDAPLMERFLQSLPKNSTQALELARKHDARVSHRSYLTVDRARRLRHAIEIRHPSFLDPSFIALLRRYGVALVFADTAGKWPYREDVTADFVYLRLHGDEEIYSSGYSRAALKRWAQRIQAWSRGSEPADAVRICERAPSTRSSRDVYCYFDNDIKVHAPFDALQLLDELGLEWAPQAQKLGKPRTSTR
jgi:uncharacterized protein YecE (DUF72 family)